MALRDLYPIPDIDPVWTVPQDFETAFDWRFDDGRAHMMRLYQKGKDMQWDAITRVDWDEELNPDNPMEMPDEMSGLFYTPIWKRRRKRNGRKCVVISRRGRFRSSCRANRRR